MISRVILIQVTKLNLKVIMDLHLDRITNLALKKNHQDLEVNCQQAEITMLMMIYRLRAIIIQTQKHPIM